MATSSNFGNMVSMAAAALFLPFLPMLPLQILLNNFLYDVSELPIPTDRVAEADLLAPRRWDTAFIRNFMLTFGLLSSIFDLLAFAVFYTSCTRRSRFSRRAWFVHRWPPSAHHLRDRSSRAALARPPSALLGPQQRRRRGFALALPYLPWGGVFGSVPMPAPVLRSCRLTLSYLAVTELAKRAFYRLHPVGGPHAP
jgi:Mg2+-importing ATPase